MRFQRRVLAGLRLVGSYSDSVLWGFFGLAMLNLRVDSCMFEMRFLMLAERLALEISLLFFLVSLCPKNRLSCARVLWMGL